MTVKTEDFLVQAWKQQLDTGLRVIETIVDGATKLHEVQIEAAADTHADAVATHKAVAAATDVSELLKLQTEWTRANAQKCGAYWRDLYGVVVQMQGELAKCVYAQSPAAAAGDGSKAALLGLIDSAYQQWLGTTQQFYKLPVLPAEEKAKNRVQA